MISGLDKRDARVGIDPIPVSHSGWSQNSAAAAAAAAMPAPTINPQTGQPDYSAAWAEYYRRQGMHDYADMILRQAQQGGGTTQPGAGAVATGTGAVVAQQQQSAAQPTAPYSAVPVSPLSIDGPPYIDCPAAAAAAERSATGLRLQPMAAVATVAAAERGGTGHSPAAAAVVGRAGSAAGHARTTGARPASPAAPGRRAALPAPFWRSTATAALVLGRQRLPAVRLQRPLPGQMSQLSLSTGGPAVATGAVLLQ